MTGSHPNRWLVLLLLLVIVTGRWLPVHSHLGAAHDHDGAHHHHRAEIHAHQAMPRHTADAIDVGHVPDHELGEIDWQQDQLARLAALSADLPDAAPPAIRLAAAHAAPTRTFFAAVEPHPASQPPPHRGEARAPPRTV